jgi:hypothetical protein
VEGKWREFQPQGRAAQRAHEFRQISMASHYHDQKEALEALHQQTNEDVFVASMQLMQQQDATKTISSWCVWSKGVQTLLPKTDLVAMNPGTDSKDVLLVAWDKLQAICGHYFKTTAEEPARFLVEDFPNQAEFESIRAAALGASA